MCMCMYNIIFMPILLHMHVLNIQRFNLSMACCHHVPCNIIMIFIITSPLVLAIIRCMQATYAPGVSKSYYEYYICHAP